MQFRVRVVPEVSGLKAPFNVQVHAVNQGTANIQVASFFERFRNDEVALLDAPEYGISIPELGI